MIDQAKAFGMLPRRRLNPYENDHRRVLYQLELSDNQIGTKMYNSFMISHSRDFMRKIVSYSEFHSSHNRQIVAALIRCSVLV